MNQTTPTRPGRTIAAAVAASALLVTLGGCSSSGTAPSSTPSVSTTAALSGSITVDAAASLNKVFPELAAAFEKAHPGTTIAFNFAGSSDLAAAIVGGSSADVFAAASPKTMATVSDKSLTASTPVTIARNKLEIAVPPTNPGKITGLKDFADASKTIVVCAKEVPCGAAAQAVFALAKITAKPDSYESSVSGVLTKVESGNADAGMVYQTDVQAAGSAVKGIPFTEADSAITAVLIAPLTSSTNAPLAAAFAQYVEQSGSADLLAAGFLAPN